MCGLEEPPEREVDTVVDRIEEEESDDRPSDDLEPDVPR